MAKGDDKQARIHELARSLKELHLAGSMEEALKRAREVLGDEDGGKSIKELMREAEGKVGKETSAAEKDNSSARSELDEDSHCMEDEADTDLKSAKHDQKDLKRVQSTVEQTGKLHKLERGDTKDALHEIDDIQCAVKDMDTMVREAEQVQKKKKK